MRHRRLIPIVLAIAMLAVPGTALAAESSTPSGGETQTIVDPGGTGGSGGSGGVGGTTDSGGVQDQPSGELPFTGFDAMTVLGAGVVLLGLGFGIRRLAMRDRRREQIAAA